MSGAAPAGPEDVPVRRHRVRGLPALLVAVVLVGGVALALRSVVGPDPSGPEAVLTGRVVDEQGTPVPGASVTVEGRAAVADARGDFHLAVPARPVLVRSDAADHLPRTQAAEPGTPEVIRLTARADETVSLRFGGDVMFGRRFYDRDEDGDRSDGLLPEDASVADHRALLQHVEPLLQDADITVVNLESPILDDPWFDPTGPRPDGYHPTKEFVFASAPEAVEALAESGVDVVSLGNNHVYDALDTGLARTVEVLGAAGIPHVGAGRTVEEAWTPAFVERKGEVVAFLGCTTITGTEHPVSYVADETHGGAARCTTQRIERAVREARARADTVVVMVHGGEEYEPNQTDLVRDLTAVALRAGAVIAVNGHPHVVGGVVADGRTVVAETVGNLLFDQTVWPTFLSYLLRVDVRGGTPVVTTVDPLLLEDYVPRPTVGLLADSAARKAAGPPSGELLLLDPGAVAPAPVREGRPVRVDGGTVARLAPHRWVTEPGAQDAVGEDLLWWTGSFEDMDTVPVTVGAHLWSLGQDVELTGSAACSGERGLALRRSPLSRSDAVAAPRHRQLVTPGTRLSLLAEVRDASPGAVLELRWYPDTRGPSSGVSTLAVPEVADAGQCVPLRLDAVVPDGVVAVQPYLRLVPPDGDAEARLAVDDVRVVAWGVPGASGRRFDTVSAGTDTTLVLTDDSGAAVATGDQAFADLTRAR